MWANGVLWAVTVAGVAAAVPLVSPSELMLDPLPGFERSGDAAVDLTYDEFAAIRPDSVAHLEPDSEQAAGLLIATETWNDATTSIAVELVVAVDEVSATTFVDQAAANAIAAGLAATDPPFVGAWSYSGGIDIWTNVVAWNQGPIAVTITQRSDVEIDSTDIGRAAVRQAERIVESTGIEVSDDAAVDEEAPPPPTEATASPEPPPPDDGGADMATAVIAVAAAGTLTAALVVLRQRRSATVDV